MPKHLCDRLLHVPGIRRTARDRQALGQPPVCRKASISRMIWTFSPSNIPSNMPPPRAICRRRGWAVVADAEVHPVDLAGGCEPGAGAGGWAGGEGVGAEAVDLRFQRDRQGGALDRQLALHHRLPLGQLSVVEQDGTTVTVFAFGITGDHVTRIWAIRNPDKLRPWATG